MGGLCCYAFIAALLLRVVVQPRLKLKYNVQGVDDTLKNNVSMCCGGVVMAAELTGMYPRTVNRMLMRKSALQPRSRKTPRGGRRMASKILQTSLAVNGMVM